MVDFTATCRCCATDIADNNKLTGLFTNIDETIKIAEVLQLCSGLRQVLPTDHRPQQICQLCRLDLWKAYSFRKRCEHSEIFFKFQLPVSPSIINDNQSSLPQHDILKTELNQIPSPLQLPPPVPDETYRQISSTNSIAEVELQQQLTNVYNSVASCKEELIIESKQEDHEHEWIDDGDAAEEYLRVESIAIEPATAEFQSQTYSVSPKRMHQLKRRRTADNFKSKQTEPNAKSVQSAAKKYLRCDICCKYFVF